MICLHTSEENGGIDLFKYYNEEEFGYDPDFLSDTDLVKFADFNPSTQALDRVTRTTYRLIRLTQENEEDDHLAKSPLNESPLNENPSDKNPSDKNPLDESPLDEGPLDENGSKEDRDDRV